MINYCFIAKSSQGTKIKGYLRAKDEEELKRIIKDYNYELIRYRKKVNHTFFTISSVKKKDLLAFLERLEMTLNAGVSLTDSLEIVMHSISNIKLRSILSTVCKEIKKGRLLSSVLCEYKKVFPEYFITMIYLGEVSGNMLAVIRHLSQTIQSEIKIENKVLSSLFYPIILLFFSIIVIVIIFNIVVPSFVSIFKEMNVTLPLITKIIIAISKFSVKYGNYVLLSILLFIFGILVFSNTKKGKYVSHILSCKLPIIRLVVKEKFYINFFKSMNIMLASGLPVVSCFQTCTNLVNNKYIKNKLIFASDEIKRGESISNAIYSTGIFPLLIVETIEIAEESANLLETVSNLSRIYEEDIDLRLTKYSQLIEPAFIIFIAVLVIVVIISIFTPLLEILKNVGV